jgi:dienelactone hydrolase
MSGRSVGFMSLVALAALFSFSEESGAAEQRFTVAASGSYTGEEFVYTRVLKEKSCRHSVYTIRYPSPVVSEFPENNTVPAELYIPEGVDADAGVPAVVCMHILNGDFALSRMMCSRLSGAGVVALFFQQPFYGERGGSEGRRRLLKSVDVLISGFDQSTADARRAFDIVQSLPGVDREKCGVTGISLGAVRAGALCAFEPRIKRAYLSLVAGDLEQIIMTARETRDLRAFIGQLDDAERARVWECVRRQDPLNAVPQLRKLAASGRLRMVRAGNDEIMPPACSLKLFDAVGYPESHLCLEGMGHYSAMAGLSGIMDDLTAFFAADMPAGWTPPPRSSGITAVSLLGTLLKDLAALIAARPKEGCAHMAGAKVSFEQGGKSESFHFELSLGTGGRFKIDGVFPAVGRAGFGRGSFPWLSGGGRIFCGTRGEGDAPALAEMIGAEAMLKYRMAAGLAAGASLSPDLINSYAKATVTNGAESLVLLLESIRETPRGRVQIAFDRSGRYPQSAQWTLDQSSGEVEFTHWQIDAAAHESLFEPDESLTRQEVLRDDVLQMFASVFRFLASRAAE